MCTVAPLETDYHLWPQKYVIKVDRSRTTIGLTVTNLLTSYTDEDKVAH
jgi:hypothetical protein